VLDLSALAANAFVVELDLFAAVSRAFVVALDLFALLDSEADSVNEDAFCPPDCCILVSVVLKVFDFTSVVALSLVYDLSLVAV
jgi:hypothetical protein